MQNEKIYTRVPLQDRPNLLEYLAYHTSCKFATGAEPNDPKVLEDECKNLECICYADGALWFVEDEQVADTPPMPKKDFCAFVEARHPQGAEWTPPNRGVNIAEMLHDAMEEQLRGRAAIEMLGNALHYLERLRMRGCESEEVCDREVCLLERVIEGTKFILGVSPDETDTPEA